MLAEEGEDLAPAIHRLLGPIEWSVPIPDAVSCVAVAVKLVDLTVVFERSLMVVYLFRARRAIVVAEYAKERARKILCHVDRRDWRLGVKLLLAHNDAAAP